MTNCPPSHTVETLPQDPSCTAECGGVTFAVSSMDTSFKDGKCGFEYTVTRTGPKGTKDFKEVESLGCPSTSSKTFSCDDAGLCPRFKVTLKCE